MQLNISSKDVKIGKVRAKIIADKLVAPLSKLLKNQKLQPNADMVVRFGSRWGYKISLNMILPKNVRIYAVTKQKEFTKAITDLREELEVQIKHYKEKLTSR